MSEDSPMDRMKEAILKDYPRLSADDRFRFKCGRDVPCFNQCCADVNIVLTPYDILRMKNRLGVTSCDLLEKYCVIPFSKKQRLPVVLLRMNDDEKKTCPFVGKEGCTIYEDRPWACRMYPVGAASPKEGLPEGEAFYFLMKEDLCEGFGKGKEWTIRSWMDDQGVGPYDEMGEPFKDISLHDRFQGGGGLEPSKMEMFFTACYDIDKFRRFVFESSFLRKFEIDDETAQKAKTDDVELMKLGFRWLRFSLFGEETVKIRDYVQKAVRKAMGVDRKQKK